MREPATVHDVGRHNATPSEADVLRTVEGLRSRAVSVMRVASREQARKAVLEAVKPPAMVITGGSQTVRDLQLATALRGRPGITYLNDDIRRTDDREQRWDARRAATAADYVIGSANAIVIDGRIVNIDGGGSRIASYAYAARRVVMVVSTTKICPTLDAALDRLRQVAVRRLAERGQDVALGPPCALDGVCRDEVCRPPVRECGKILIIEKETVSGRILVVLVDEPLGF